MSPRVIRADEVRDIPNGAGRRRARLVDAVTGGVEGMTLDRIALDAGARGPTIEHPGAESFLYVIRGSGAAGDLSLEPETMIWLEPGDRLSLVAGADGLEVLLAQARR